MSTTEDKSYTKAEALAEVLAFHYDSVNQASKGTGRGEVDFNLFKNANSYTVTSGMLELIIEFALDRGSELTSAAPSGENKSALKPDQELEALTKVSKAFTDAILDETKRCTGELARTNITMEIELEKLRAENWQSKLLTAKMWIMLEILQGEKGGLSSKGESLYAKRTENMSAADIMTYNNKVKRSEIFHK